MHATKQRCAQNGRARQPLLARPAVATANTVWSRLDLCFGVSKLAALIHEATVGDLLAANKLKTNLKYQQVKRL